MLTATTNTDELRWSPAGTLNSAVVTNPVAMPSDTTIYSVVGLSDNTCPNDTGYVQVNVRPAPVVSASAAPVVTTPGNPVSLLAEGSADIVRYSWQPSSKLSNASARDPLWRYPDTTTTFNVLVQNAAGCTDTSSVVVRVVCSASSVMIPNAFTPGGKNPFFRPLGIHKSNPAIRKFTVFNRWGQIVYSVENTTAFQVRGWDGSVNNRPQDAGNYIWILELDCTEGVMVKKGFVIMIR
jgi:gliding motility-associated-like protein